MPTRFAFVPPNWFVSVMGTGIVAIGASSLPFRIPGMQALAVGFWVLGAVLLLVVCMMTAVHWVRDPEVARGHLSDPVLMHFTGAAPMAFLTVGAATLVAGRTWMGVDAAIVADRVLWSIGAVGAFCTVIAVPVSMFLRGGRESGPPRVFGGWLMPVVPPIVAATTGALLVPSTPVGEPRATVYWACWSLIGMSFVAAFAIIVLLWGALIRDGVGAPGGVPTLWIVLGPVGQSMTATGLLGGTATAVLDPETARIVRTVTVMFGFVMAGFALLWTSIVVAITARTARVGLPFGLPWWSFTFPIGTCVTGFNELAAHTGLVAVGVLAVAYFVGLLVAWTIVSVRTFHGSVVTGRLLARPVPVPTGTGTVTIATGATPVV